MLAHRDGALEGVLAGVIRVEVGHGHVAVAAAAGDVLGIRVEREVAHRRRVVREALDLPGVWGAGVGSSSRGPADDKSCGWQMFRCRILADRFEAASTACAYMGK